MSPSSLFSKKGHFSSRANTASGGDASPPRLLGKEREARENDFPDAAFLFRFSGEGGNPWAPKPIFFYYIGVLGPIFFYYINEPKFSLSKYSFLTIGAT